MFTFISSSSCVLVCLGERRDWIDWRCFMQKKKPQKKQLKKRTKLKNSSDSEKKQMRESFRFFLLLLFFASSGRNIPDIVNSWLVNIYSYNPTFLILLLLSFGCSRKWQQRQDANRCRMRLALGPGRAGCHTGTRWQRVWEFVVEEKKKKQEWFRVPPCPLLKDVWTSTWRRSRSVEWGTQFSDPGQVNACTSFRMVNYRKATARQGRSMLHRTWDAANVTQDAATPPPPSQILSDPSGGLSRLFSEA